jgi:hypothetical protein
MRGRGGDDAATLVISDSDTARLVISDSDAASVISDSDAASVISDSDLVCIIENPTEATAGDQQFRGNKSAGGFIAGFWIQLGGARGGRRSFASDGVEWSGAVAGSTRALYIKRERERGRGAVTRRKVAGQPN